MLNLKKIIFVLALGFLLIGCDGDSTPTPITINEGVVWGEITENQGYEMLDVTFQLATPLYPFFIITGAELNSCVGNDYIAVAVKNTGPYYFQYGTMYANNGSEVFSVYPKDFNPFHFSPTQCPLGPGSSGLWPGGSAWVYIPVEHNALSYTDVNYHLVVNLCTYIGDPPSSPDNCVTRDYDLTIDSWMRVDVEVLEEYPCYYGPGPYKYDVVSSLRKGEVVELLGMAMEPDWSVVMNNMFGVKCFVPTKVLFPMDGPAADSKDDEHEAGEEKDTSCPQGEKYNEETGECEEKPPKCGDNKDRDSCALNDDCTWDDKNQLCKEK